MSRNSQKPGKASRISINMSSCLTAEGSPRTLLEPFPPLSYERNRSCRSPAGSSQKRPILILIFLALQPEDCCASSSHSLYYSYTFVSKPSQGLPQFSILESVDGQPIAHYDSKTKEYLSLVPWMEKVKKEESLWEEYTGIAKKAEQDFGRNLVTLQKYYNHSEGFHTLQWRYGCKLSHDQLRGGSDQDSYDGRTFISFDKETLSWIASDTAAQLSKRKLEGKPSVAKHIKYYLEETCIEMLRRRITYGKEVLLRKEPPSVTVTSKTEASQRETHICRVDGFFPKDIKATWRKDGEIYLKDTLHGLVAPSSDGTYHFWLSITINPSERNHFQCHVEHDSLKSPLKVVLMVPAPHAVSIIITVLAAILMVLTIGWGLCLAVHIQIKFSQASPDERNLNTRYRILGFVGLLLLILNLIGLLYFFDLIAGSTLLRFIFLGVFLSCCLLGIVGLSVWIRLKKKNVRPLSSGQNAIASENHRESSNSGRSNLEEIPLQQTGVFNNTAGEENQREDLRS